MLIWMIWICSTKSWGSKHELLAIQGSIRKQLIKHTSAQMQLLINFISQHTGLSDQQTIAKGNGIYLMRPWLSINSIRYHVIAFKSIKQAGGLARLSFPWLCHNCLHRHGLKSVSPETKKNISIIKTLNFWKGIAYVLDIVVFIYIIFIISVSLASIKFNNIFLLFIYISV